MKRRLFYGLILIIAMMSSTQNSEAQSVVNGAYIKEHIPTKQMIKYTYLREADVMWEKRVWRRIDVREKMNFPLYYPLKPINDDRMCLFEVLKRHVFETPDMITVYRWTDEMKYIIDGTIDGDQFTTPILNDSYREANVFGIYNVIDSAKCELIVCTDPTDPTTCDKVLDPVTGKVLIDTTLLKFASQTYANDDVVAWDIKEDWFFDKQRSVMDVRIIGIAPVVYLHEKANDLESPVIGTRALCWFYFPQIRPIIQNYFVYNRKNDAQRMSFDDLFWKRTFSSYITKESSIFDRKINDYTAGIDALLESEKIKKEMMELEHDVWEF